MYWCLNVDGCVVGWLNRIDLNNLLVDYYEDLFIYVFYFENDNKGSW